MIGYFSVIKCDFKLFFGDLNKNNGLRNNYLKKMLATYESSGVSVVMEIFFLLRKI